MQEYADFTVDSRPPVFRKPESQTYRQMSFDDYNREHIEKHGEPIREVRRLSVITDGNPIYNADQLFYHINGTDYAMEF
ncbi:hypothetical protein [Sharpea azabuensis]|uniref:hypothetical protein n=1 Tax=Sharpea azabuensis TaxID=322505 RepID=UPI001567F865|nr:hypothetical protein [Sharpea azabuensis]